MNSVLLAERAVFAYFKPVRRVFLVLVIVVISLLAFGTSQRNSRSNTFCHNFCHPKKLTPPYGVLIDFTIYIIYCQVFFTTFFIFNILWWYWAKHPSIWGSAPYSALCFAHFEINRAPKRLNPPPPKAWKPHRRLRGAAENMRWKQSLTAKAQLSLFARRAFWSITG